MLRRIAQIDEELEPPRRQQPPGYYDMLERERQYLIEQTSKE